MADINIVGSRRFFRNEMPKVRAATSRELLLFVNTTPLNDWIPPLSVNGIDLSELGALLVSPGNVDAENHFHGNGKYFTTGLRNCEYWLVGKTNAEGDKDYLPISGSRPFSGFESVIQTSIGESLCPGLHSVHIPYDPGNQVLSYPAGEAHVMGDIPHRLASYLRQQ